MKFLSALVLLFSAVSNANAAGLQTANDVLKRFLKCGRSVECRGRHLSAELAAQERAAFSEWLFRAGPKIRLRACGEAETRRMALPSAPKSPFFCFDGPNRLGSENGFLFVEPVKKEYKLHKAVILPKNPSL